MDKALLHFKHIDPTMYTLASAEGLVLPKKLTKSEYFPRLVQSVVGQQLSVKAAATIRGRLINLSGELTPQKLISLSHAQLRNVGLSNAKASYLHAISRSVRDQEVALDGLDKQDDEEVMTELTKLKGIGPWSAEMFLMFVLGRPDVFSFGDQGLKNAVVMHYGKLPASKLERLVRSWSPHRTIAAKALWHSLDNSPK